MNIKNYRIIVSSLVVGQALFAARPKPWKEYFLDLACCCVNRETGEPSDATAAPSSSQDSRFQALLEELADITRRLDLANGRIEASERGINRLTDSQGNIVELTRGTMEEMRRILANEERMIQGFGTMHENILAAEERMQGRILQVAQSNIQDILAAEERMIQRFRTMHENILAAEERMTRRILEVAQSNIETTLVDGQVITILLVATNNELQVWTGIPHTLGE